MTERIFDDPLARDPATRALLRAIEGCVPATAPPPSAELLLALSALADRSVVLSGVPLATAGRSRPQQHRRTGRSSRLHKVTVALAAAVAVGAPATGVAAAYDGLPGPAEHLVTRVVNDWTPFTIDPTQDIPGRSHPKPGTPVRVPVPAAPRTGRSGAPGSGSAAPGTGPAEPSEPAGLLEPTATEPGDATAPGSAHEQSPGATATGANAEPSDPVRPSESRPGEPGHPTGGAGRSGAPGEHRSGGPTASPSPTAGE